MKGFFLQAGKEFVIKHYNQEIWRKAAESCGFNPDTLIMPFADIPDRIIICIAQKVSEISGKTLEEVTEEFGKYWITEATHDLYGVIYRNTSCLKEFLENVNHFHQLVAKNTPGSHPPNLEIWWENDKTMVLRYESPRNFYPLAVGCVKGAVTLFREKALVETIPPDKIKVRFGR